MENSGYKRLVYQIIGMQEAWLDDHTGLIKDVLNKTSSPPSEEDFTELALVNRILSRLRDHDMTLEAFSALLDKSCFKMVILNESLVPIYHNRSAKQLRNYLVKPNAPCELNDKLTEQIRIVIDTERANQADGQDAAGLIPLDATDQHGDNIYLRSVQNQKKNNTSKTYFHHLLVLDRSRQHTELNSEFIELYSLTEKEQLVLSNLIHGKSIKTIAAEVFLSENTIKTHLKALFRKTKTRSQTGLVRFILNHESQLLESYFDNKRHTSRWVNDDVADCYATLPGGQVIAYREYGPKTGRPTLLFHNSYGCRITIPEDYNRICHENHRRVFIPDRPGFGKTEYFSDQPSSWNHYLSQFIDVLKLNNYDIMATSLACAMAINFASQANKHLKKMILVSPMMINTDADHEHLTGVFRSGFQLTKKSPKFARELYLLWLKNATHNLDTQYREMLISTQGVAERKIFEEQDTIDLIVESFRECARYSLEGISNETIFCLTPQNLDLSKIEIPVDIWWGTQDTRVTHNGVIALAKQLPNAKLHVCEGYTEHIYYALFEEMTMQNCSQLTTNGQDVR